jgi:hypothetical protein
LLSDFQVRKESGDDVAIIDATSRTGLDPMQRMKFIHASKMKEPRDVASRGSSICDYR